jgi:ABC-type branched-subunit amino acid transport system ATPase component
MRRLLLAVAVTAVSLGTATAQNPVKISFISILIIDKSVEVLIRMADRHHLIERGRIVWSGTSHELGRAPELQHRYLGV